MKHTILMFVFIAFFMLTSCRRSEIETVEKKNRLPLGYQPVHSVEEARAAIGFNYEMRTPPGIEIDGQYFEGMLLEVNGISNSGDFGVCEEPDTDTFFLWDIEANTLTPFQTGELPTYKMEVPMVLNDQRAVAIAGKQIVFLQTDKEPVVWDDIDIESDVFEGSFARRMGNWLLVAVSGKPFVWDMTTGQRFKKLEQVVGESGNYGFYDINIHGTAVGEIDDVGTAVFQGEREELRITVEDYQNQLPEGSFSNAMLFDVNDDGVVVGNFRGENESGDWISCAFMWTKDDGLRLIQLDQHGLLNSDFGEISNSGLIIGGYQVNKEEAFLAMWKLDNIDAKPVRVNDMIVNRPPELRLNRFIKLADDNSLLAAYSTGLWDNRPVLLKPTNIAEQDSDATTQSNE